jgi:hypothetical protein
MKHNKKSSYPCMKFAGCVSFNFLKLYYLFYFKAETSHYSVLKSVSESLGLGTLSILDKGPNVIGASLPSKTKLNSVV